MRCSCIFQLIVLVLSFTPQVFASQKVTVFNDCELWLVEQISKGEEADFSSYIAKNDDPKYIHGAIIGDILVNKDIVRGNKYHGIVVKNVPIFGDININGAQHEYQIAVQQCNVYGKLSINNSSLGPVSFSGTSFYGDVNLRHANFKNSLYFGGLYLDRKYSSKNVYIKSLTIGDVVVAGDLSILGSKLNIVSLSGVHSSDLAVRNCTINNELHMWSSDVSGQLVVVDCDILNKWNEFHKYTDERACSLYDITVKRSIHFERSSINGLLYLESVDTNNISLGPTTLSSVVVENCNVRGLFSLRNYKKENKQIWREKSYLKLISSKIKCLVASPNHKYWPKTVVINNSHIDYFKVPDEVHLLPETEKDSWDANGMAQWLMLSGNKFNINNWISLSKTLDESGKTSEAKKLRFIGKYRQMMNDIFNANIINTVITLSYFAIVGFGEYPWMASVWILAFIVMGAYVFRRTVESRIWKMPYGFFYSFDMLLPIVKLRDMHYKIDLSGKERYYFYFHKVMGYVLGICIAASVGSLIIK